MNYKTCTRCNKNKATQEFYVRSSKMWYGHLVCKQCCKEKRAIDKKVATGLFDDMSKVCTKCFRDKWLDDFEYHPTGLHDRRSVCKSCRKDYANSRLSITKQQQINRVFNNPEKYRLLQQKYDTTWYLKNSDKAKEYSRKYKQLNKDAVKEYMVEYRKLNLDKIRQVQREYSYANSDKRAAAAARRRAKKRQATPGWALTNDSFIMIASLYQESREVSINTGIKHHVDHIVPLTSDTVCGLHCIDNLQVIPSYMNQSKGNRTWPDMP